MLQHVLLLLVLCITFSWFLQQSSSILQNNSITQHRFHWSLESCSWTREWLVSCFVQFLIWPPSGQPKGQQIFHAQMQNSRGWETILANTQRPSSEKWHIPSNFISKSTLYCQMPRGPRTKWRSDAREPGFFGVNNWWCPGGISQGRNWTRQD